MKLPKEIDLARLCLSIQTGRKALEAPRRDRAASVREAAGQRHGEGGSALPVPVNVIDLYERTVSRFLFGKNPRVMLTTSDPRQESAVAAAESWCNDEVERMDLADTLKRIGVDALHLFGVAKVGLADPADAERRGWRLSAGAPFCDLVDPDDFVADPFARTPAEFTFVGNRFRTSVRVARKIYARGKAAREALTSEDISDYNDGGDERIGVIGRGTGRVLGEWEDRLDLWDIYLPEHRLVLTLRDDAARGCPTVEEPLLVRPWVGSARGPYAAFGLGVVAGHWMPKGPVQNLMEMHLNLNQNVRKLNRQAARVKKVMPMRGDTKDYDRLTQTSDGFGFQCDTPELMREMVVNEPVSSLHVYAQWTHQMLNEMAGNLPALAGLGPQAKTATQDRLIHEASSRSVTDMQEDSLNFTADVMRRLLWLWWNHPQKVMRSRWRSESDPSVGRTLRVFPRGTNPRDPRDNPRRVRQGPPPDLKVDPYSLVHKTPQARWAFIKQTVAELMPLMPLLRQQGITFDAQAYLRLGRKYNDEPDITTLFTITPPPPDKGTSPDAGGDVLSVGGDKTTTIERRSMGDSSGQKRKADLMAEVMGGAGLGNGAVNPSSNGTTRR